VECLHKSASGLLEQTDVVVGLSTVVVWSIGMGRVIRRDYLIRRRIDDIIRIQVRSNWTGSGEGLIIHGDRMREGLRWIKKLFVVEKLKKVKWSRVLLYVFLTLRQKIHLAVSKWGRSCEFQIPFRAFSTPVFSTHQWELSCLSKANPILTENSSHTPAYLRWYDQFSNHYNSWYIINANGMNIKLQCCLAIVHIELICTSCSRLYVYYARLGFYTSSINGCHFKILEHRLTLKHHMTHHIVSWQLAQLFSNHTCRLASKPFPITQLQPIL
jgi:hypothetical protein